MNFVNTSLFVGDLPKFCNEPDLEQLFAPYGPIVDAKIKRNVNTGKTLSYGFVTLSSESAANEALKNLDGAMFLGRKLRIRWAMYNARSQNAVNIHGSVINSVYVRFVSSKVDHYITEEDLHRVFDPFGCVLDVSIKESSVDSRNNRQSGYGFVHFSCDTMGIEAAFQAVAALDNSTVDSITFNVELSKNLLKQFNADGSSPRKDDVGHGSASPSKNLGSPNRSMSNVHSASMNNFSPVASISTYPVTPIREGFDRVPSVELSPFKTAEAQIGASPLRSVPGNTAAVKFSQGPHLSHIKSPVNNENGLSRYSNRLERTPSQSNVFSHSNIANNNINSFSQRMPSRENSFRSVGNKSKNGSFHTLNARSSSTNSITSSFGNTTVSCTTTSSPSPFCHGSVAIDNLEKINSFRSDPGASRVYSAKSGYIGHSIADPSSPNLMGQNGTHSLSFQESPLSRSLFSTQNSRFSGSEISLLSVPGQNILDYNNGSFHGSFHSNAGNYPPRPDSRASDCSDVSTDSEENQHIITAEGGLDALFASHPPHRHHADEDFFTFLNHKKTEMNNKSPEHHTSHHHNRSNQSMKISHHSLPTIPEGSAFGTSSLLDLESIDLRFNSQPPISTFSSLQIPLQSTIL